MRFVELMLLAFGLSLDAMAVATAKGISTSSIRARHVVLVALIFGGFQALMPLGGYLIGKQVGPWIEAWDHWVAFLLLGGIGAKMIFDAWKNDDQVEPSSGDPFAIKTLLVLGVATSIDALAAGLTLPTLGVPITAAILAIGLTTATLSALGLTAGQKLGGLFGNKLEILGGVVLVGLGVKILIEHLVADGKLSF